MKRFALGLLSRCVFCPDFAAQALAGTSGKTIRMRSRIGKTRSRPDLVSGGAWRVAEKVEIYIVCGLPAMRDAPMTKGQFLLIMCRMARRKRSQSRVACSALLRKDVWLQHQPSGTTSVFNTNGNGKVWNGQLTVCRAQASAADSEIGKRIDDSISACRFFAWWLHGVGIAEPGLMLKPLSVTAIQQERIGMRLVGQGGADLHRLDKKLFNQSTRARFSSVVSIDPGWRRLSQRESCGISIPTLVINWASRQNSACGGCGPSGQNAFQGRTTGQSLMPYISSSSASAAKCPASTR